MFLQPRGRIVGLAVDSRNGYLFWSDVSHSKKGIYRCRMNGADVKKLIHAGKEKNNCILTFSIRFSYLCPILSHSDCSVIYMKQNVTPKYYIQNKSTFYLSSNIKYEACNVMKRLPHLVIQ